VGTPFGGLLVDPRFLAIWPGPAAGGRLTLPIPGDIGFAGIQLYFQGALLGPARRTSAAISRVRSCGAAP
jgi:hypothetical protein